MKGMREIRSRIKAVKSTGQITHAMQLVASSKMKRAQQLAQAGRAYNMLLLDMMDTLNEMGASKGYDYPMLKPREIKKRLVIVFSTDKGLCGPLNSNMFKEIAAMGKDCAFIAIGNKAARFLSATKRELLAHFNISDKVKFSELKSVVDFAISEYTNGNCDTIEVLYPNFINTLKQDTTLQKIVPIDNFDELLGSLKKKYKSTLTLHGKDDRELLIEPSPKELFKKLGIYYVRNTIYQVALNAKASEQSARMVSMKAASDNADNLIAELSLQYNKARQESITNEIVELSAGMTQSKK